MFEDSGSIPRNARVACETCLCVTTKKVWLPDRHTDRQTPEKVIPICRYASQATQKWCIGGSFPKTIPVRIVNNFYKLPKEIPKELMSQNAAYKNTKQMVKGVFGNTIRHTDKVLTMQYKCTSKRTLEGPGVPKRCIQECNTMAKGVFSNIIRHNDKVLTMQYKCTESYTPASCIRCNQG